jgi:hypothetical protein
MEVIWRAILRTRLRHVVPNRDSRNNIGGLQLLLVSYGLPLRPGILCWITPTSSVSEATKHLALTATSDQQFAFLTSARSRRQHRKTGRIRGQRATGSIQLSKNVHVRNLKHRILKRRWRRFRIGVFAVRLGHVGSRGGTNI